MSFVMAERDVTPLAPCNDRGSLKTLMLSSSSLLFSQELRDGNLVRGVGRTDCTCMGIWVRLLTRMGRLDDCAPGRSRQELTWCKNRGRYVDICEPAG
jgi:hypothetical protein